MERCARSIDCRLAFRFCTEFVSGEDTLRPGGPFAVRNFWRANLPRTTRICVFIESTGAHTQIFMPSLCNPYGHFHLLIGSGNDFAGGGSSGKPPRARPSRSTSNPEG